MSDSETWITIEEAPRYAVSNLGRVKNKKTGHILKPRIRGKGHPAVALYKDGHNPIWRKVHILVIEAFISVGRDDLAVRHIDGDNKNNNLNNLEWHHSSKV